MSSVQHPQKNPPTDSWEHYDLWMRIKKLIYALPNYFETEIVVKGINAPDLYSIGGVFSTAIESSLVEVLNKTRNIWDADNSYSTFAFQRQSQTFPDVLFVDLLNKDNIIFGIELKAWYALSKESEPSFRFKIDPEACASADLLVVFPWLLSEVTAGKPTLLPPYVELARYAAECRNYYWAESRIRSSRNSTIKRPEEIYRRPYPRAKENASDSAEDDRGNNFGRIARSGQGNLLESYLDEIENLDCLGIKIKYWVKIFKAIAEGRDADRIDSDLDRALDQLRLDFKPPKPD